MENKVVWYIDICNKDAQQIINYLKDRDIDYVETMCADIADIELDSIKKAIINGYTVICIGLTDDNNNSHFMGNIICVLEDYYNRFIELFKEYGNNNK